MSFLADLPQWAVVMLALIAAVILVVLNLGWLMSAKAMLDGHARARADSAAAPKPPASDPNQR